MEEGQQDGERWAELGGDQEKHLQLFQPHVFQPKCGTQGFPDQCVKGLEGIEITFALQFMTTTSI